MDKEGSSLYINIPVCLVSARIKRRKMNPTVRNYQETNRVRVMKPKDEKVFCLGCEEA